MLPKNCDHDQMLNAAHGVPLGTLWIRRDPGGTKGVLHAGTSGNSGCMKEHFAK